MNVCHYVLVTDSYTLMAVNTGEPLDAHLGHGDAFLGDPVPTMPGYRFDAGCAAESVAARRFAVAFTNVDLVAGYDPAADRLIAELVDSNRNGIPDAGDTVTTNAFPLDFTTTGPIALATITTFTVSRVEVRGVNDLGAVNDLGVFSGSDQSLSFLRITADNRNGELYREETWTGPPYQRFTYLEDLDSYNTLLIRPDSPSATGVYGEQGSSDAGDAWFDVWIDIENYGLTP